MVFCVLIGEGYILISSNVWIKKVGERDVYCVVVVFLRRNTTFVSFSV